MRALALVSSMLLCLLCYGPISSLLLAAEAQPTGGDLEFDPYAVVGICAVPSGQRSWSIVWHPDASSDEKQALTVLRNLASPAFNDCLALLIESDDTTRDQVLKYAGDKTEAAAMQALEAVQRHWTSYGVDVAIREVANTGSAGPAIARVLDACQKIRVPQRIEGWTTEAQPPFRH